MYCTLDDLLDRVSEDILVDITTDGGIDATTIDQNKVNKAIEDVSALIDSFAQKKYQVPFSPVPRVIKKIAVDLVLYELFASRGIDEERDQHIIRSQKTAMSLLDKIASGALTIGIPSPPPDNGLRVESQKRVFSRESLSDF
ncbi:MAG: hypothetical protein PWR10_1544 [Halanaerobiales bacterium]|nr:hypothetical protein [Halanaerobiales bacterium]